MRGSHFLGTFIKTLKISLLSRRYKLDDENKKCLRDLFVVDPQSDMATIQRLKDKLLHDAYKWILSTKEYALFTNWSNNESNLSPCSLLWMRGPTGTGKTMLSIGIIRELSNQPAMLTSLSTPDYYWMQTDRDSRSCQHEAMTITKHCS